MKKFINCLNELFKRNINEILTLTSLLIIGSIILIIGLLQFINILLNIIGSNHVLNDYVILKLNTYFIYCGIMLFIVTVISAFKK